MSEPSQGSLIPPDSGQYGGYQYQDQYQYQAGPDGQYPPAPGNGPTGAKRSLGTRLASMLDSGQKVVIALTALVVAVGGLVAAIKAAQSGSPDGVSALQPGSAISTSGAPVAPLVVSTSSPGPTAGTSGPLVAPSPTPPASPGPTTDSQLTESQPPVTTVPPAQPTSAPVHVTFRGTQTITVGANGFLMYRTPQGLERAASYMAPLFAIGSSGVRMSVLNSPATSSTAYAACENDTDSQLYIEVDTLASGASICLFTPDNQLLWVQPKLSTTEYDSNVLTAIVSTWQGSGT